MNETMYQRWLLNKYMDQVVGYAYMKGESVIDYAIRFYLVVDNGNQYEFKRFKEKRYDSKINQNSSILNFGDDIKPLKVWKELNEQRLSKCMKKNRTK